MGAKIILCIPLLLLLCGCTQTIEHPYVYVEEGVYACEETVWEHGKSRSRTPTDTQALQYVTDDRGIELSHGELAHYTGTLYSLSNYRELLLEHGYIVEKEVRTASVLDTTLSCSGDRVRIIYQQSGSIRILFENEQGVAHILLEGV